MQIQQRQPVTIDDFAYICLDNINSRNPLGKGFKYPLRFESKDSWEEILLSPAKYLL